MCAHTSGVCCHLGGEWGSNGRRLPICALTSGVSCQGQRLGREPTGMRPGRPTALAAGARYVHSYRESPASRTSEEWSGRAGREGTLHSLAADPPPREWRGSRRGGGMRAGPRGARREPRPARTPAAWLPAWPSRAGASAPLAGRGSSRADGKRIPRVRVGRGFRHPGTGGGGRLPESPPRVYARDEASDAGPPRRWRSPVEGRRCPNSARAKERPGEMASRSKVGDGSLTCSGGRRRWGAALHSQTFDLPS